MNSVTSNNLGLKYQRNFHLFAFNDANTLYSWLKKIMDFEEIITL